MPNAHLNLLAAARPGIAPQVTVLLGAGAELEAAVHAAIAPVAAGARIIRSSNPLRSPLTTERILIQAGQEEIGLLPDDAADEAMQRLCQRRTGESRVVLVIEQAETLAISTLRTLARLVAPNGRPSGALAPLHLILAGGPSFKSLLREPALLDIRAAITTLPSAAHAEAVPAPAAAHVQAWTGPVVPPAPDVFSLAASAGLGQRDAVPPVPEPDWHGAPPGVLLEEQALAPLPPAGPALPRLLRACAAAIILSALGAGAVVGLPYALGWLSLS